MPPKTKLVFAAAGRWGLLPDLTFFVMPPTYERFGPVSLRQGAVLADQLAAGHYKLTGRLLPAVDLNIDFKIDEGGTTTLHLTDTLGTLQRLLHRPPPEPAILYIRKATPHVSHFWIGHCDSDEALGALLSDAAYYSLDDEARDTAFLSDFARSQCERWYDHDFVEAGWGLEGEGIAHRFRGHSWVDIWADALEKQARAVGLRDPNCFIMLGGDPERPMDRDLASPQDIHLPTANLRYVGKIAFTHF